MGVNAGAVAVAVKVVEGSPVVQLEIIDGKTPVLIRFSNRALAEEFLGVIREHVEKAWPCHG